MVQTLLGLRHYRNLGLTTTSIAAVTDTSVIERSWGLLSTIPSRKDQFYGPRFSWVEVFKARNWFQGIALHVGLVIGAFLLMMVPPVRTLVRRFVYQPGEGPTKEETTREEVEYRGTATPDSDTATTKQAFVRAQFHGGMYARRPFTSESVR